jgi:chromosomal replication initiation ATPase DnaA
MKEQFKHFDYMLTDDPEFMNKRTGITPELFRQMESLHKKALKGGQKNIDYLLLT